MRSTSTAQPPTAKQLSYLRALAAKTASTFTCPASRSEASREIERLKSLKAAGRPLPSESCTDPRALYAPGVRSDEIAGRGSSARWRHHPPADRQEKGVSSTGRKVQLARYEAAGEQRVIYGHRVNGRAHVIDLPADGEGRGYVIERDVHRDGRPALEALIADYTTQARQTNLVPMASSVLARELQAAASGSADAHTA